MIESEAGSAPPVRWEEFRQRVRAHRPSELLPAIAAESARQFDGGPLRIDPRRLQPWALAAIARESLAWGNEHRTAPVGPNTLRKLHALYADLDDPFLRGADGPWDIFVRISYEQGGWQGPIYSGLARFVAMLDRNFGEQYEILTRGTLGEVLGADPTIYYGASMLFTVSAGRNSGWFDLRWLEQPQFAKVVQRVPAAALRQVFARSFGAPYAVVAARARADRNPHPALRQHDPNPLAATPYIEMRPGAYLAPSPRLVADRASLNAVYHHGQQRWGDRFTRDLGRLVEAYAGEQLGQVPGGSLTGERPYGRGGGAKTVDWLLVLPDVVVLVEVKSARVAARGSLDLAGWVDEPSRV